jgi:hypothetical protein
MRVILDGDGDADLIAFLRELDPDGTVELGPRRCEHCGEPFAASRSDARYCTPKCRHAAWRARTANG